LQEEIMSSTSSFLDIAIIGGGISGIYSGWRLATAQSGDSALLSHWMGAGGGKLKIGVFEKSHRIGGRLLSAQSPNTPETVCEIGGMRYVSSQTLVRSLVENELKLARHQQVVDEPNNLAYLRGEYLRGSQTSDSEYLPFGITWGEAQYLMPPSGKPNPPDALIGYAATKILPKLGTITGPTLHKYLRDAEVDGIPLYKHGFWNLLARAMSSEALSLSKTMVGYDSLGCNANAVDMITEYFDFTPGVQYYLLDEGYDAVPWELQKRFTDAGGSVSQDASLEGFESATLPDGSTGVELHFGNGQPSVTSRAILLAMPRRSIELLAQRGPVLDPQKAPGFQNLLNSVEPVPLFKLFLVYPYPWWSAVSVSQGRSLTDLPVHQCYYWPNGPKGTMDPKGPGIIMAYNDETGVEFWGGLQNSGQDHPQLAAAAAPSNPYKRRLHRNWADNKAPREMVAEMHRQLVLMHNIDYAPQPIDAAYMDWSNDPYGGGVHFWNIGYKSWEILERMTKPVHDFPCFICGEAWSTNQTWAEGALQTAEIVLQKHFHLPPPSWVTQTSAAQSAGASGN
jgi:hypothetical protein